MKVSIFSSAVGSFCWNYATDTFYSNYAGANFFAIMQVSKFYCNYVGGTKLEVSAAFMQVKVFAANMWVTNFIEIMQVGLSYNHAGSTFCRELCTWLFLL